MVCINDSASNENVKAFIYSYYKIEYTSCKIE